MKDKVGHESSQSDENNEALNRSSASAIPPFDIPGELAKYPIKYQLVEPQVFNLTALLSWLHVCTGKFSWLELPIRQVI